MKKSIFFVFLVAMLVVLGGNDIIAQVDNGVPISNSVKAFANNTSITSTAAAPITNVQLIVGASFTVIQQTNTPGAAGSTANLSFTIRNDGNDTDTFQFSFAKISSNNVDPDPWAAPTWSGGANTAALIPGATAAKILQVPVHGNAVNAATYLFQIQAQSLAGSPIKANKYRSDDLATVFGGDMGIGWTALTNVTTREATNSAFSGILTTGPVCSAAGTAVMGNRVTVQGPVLGISKTLTMVSLGSVNDATAVPGATIQYTIVVSNAGPIAASNVRIKDAIDTASVAYDSYSVSNISPATYEGGYAAGTFTLSNSAAGGILGTNAATGQPDSEKVVFTIDVIIQ